jgi:hypothetical protein
MPSTSSCVNKYSAHGFKFDGVSLTLNTDLSFPTNMGLLYNRTERLVFPGQGKIISPLSSRLLKIKLTRENGSTAGTMLVMGM